MDAGFNGGVLSLDWYQFIQNQNFNKNDVAGISPKSSFRPTWSN